jgi:hypothetical protein
LSFYEKTSKANEVSNARHRSTTPALFGGCYIAFASSPKIITPKGNPQCPPHRFHLDSGFRESGRQSQGRFSLPHAQNQADERLFTRCVKNVWIRLEEP